MSKSSSAEPPPTDGPDSQPVPTPRPSRNRPARELRKRIVEVATRLFATRGFSATSMREVALGAGCTKPALYYYFDNKAALFLAIIREETDRIGVLLEEHLGAQASLRVQLCGALAAYLQHVREEPHTLSLLHRAELHSEHGQPTFDFRSVREMYSDRLLRVLQTGVERGELREGIDLEDVLAVLMGIADYRSTLWLTERKPIPQDYPERMLSLLFGGIAP